MSIPSTINSIEEHIENAYDALALGGEDLTNVDKNLTNINLGLKNRYEDFLANGTDVIWNNWENKSTQEGASLHFDNTIEAKMESTLKGNINQYQPTGKNLFNKNTITANKYFNVDGILQNSNNWCVSDFIPVISNNNYTFSGVLNTGDGYTIFYDANQDFISSTKANIYTVTIPENAVYLKLSLNTNNPEFVQLELGSSASNFEPYSEGTIAPNPNYPQNIQVVTGNNDIKILGKNLIKIAEGTSSTDTTISNNIINVTFFNDVQKEKYRVACEDYSTRSWQYSIRLDK